jgi:hypothetical protein
MRKTFLTCAIINCFLTFSQNKNDYYSYYLNLNKTDCIENIDTSIYYYKKAFEYVKSPNSLHVFNLVNLLFKKNEKREGIKWLKKSILLGLKFESDSSILEPDRILSCEYGIINLTSSSSKDIKNYVSKHYKKLRKKYLSNCIYNDPIYKLLQNEIQFQTLRIPIYDSLHSEKYKKLNSFGYSVNSYLLWGFLKENKIPYRHESAYLNNHSLSILLIHSLLGFLNENDVKEFLGELKKSIYTGLITPDEYAKVYDCYIHRYVDKDITYYGTQASYDSIAKQIRVHNLFNSQELNEFRKIIWLSDFDCFLNNMNYLKPNNYE